MSPKKVVDLFSSSGGLEIAKSYLVSEGILDTLLKIEARSTGRLPPDYRDLARLHLVNRKRKVFTILEFGVGYSTLVMADALKKNEQDWKLIKNKPAIRNSSLFELHTLDTELEWINMALFDLPPELRKYVISHHSNVELGKFNGRDCHFYGKIPDVVPDLVYLDGPDPRAVILPGNEARISGWGVDRVVIAADILQMESWLLPGTMVIVDGRTSNVRFLKHHFYRQWEVASNWNGDITAFELQEFPLGNINLDTLQYCLDSRVDEWS
jgi:hypothetical protein